MGTASFGDVGPICFIALFWSGPLILYLLAWVGLTKSWYMSKPTPGLPRGCLMYGVAAFGLGFPIILLAILLPGIDDKSFALTILSFAFLGVLLMIFAPSWIKPPWVRWLEREYGDHLDILAEEVQEMGCWRWEAQVRTRAALEQWAQQAIIRSQNRVDKQLLREQRASERRRKIAAMDLQEPLYSHYAIGVRIMSWSCLTLMIWFAVGAIVSTGEWGVAEVLGSIFLSGIFFSTALAVFKFSRQVEVGTEVVAIVSWLGRREMRWEYIDRVKYITVGVGAIVFYSGDKRLVVGGVALLNRSERQKMWAFLQGYAEHLGVEQEFEPAVG